MIAKAKTSLGVRINLESRFKKPKILELNVLRAILAYLISLLIYTITLLRAKSLSNLLEATKLYERFFLISDHLKIK